MHRMTPTLFLALFCIATLSATIPVKSVHADQGKMVVANRATGDISVIDTQSDTVTNFALPAGAGLNPPEPMYVAYSSPFRRVFVGDRANNRVVVFSASDFSVEGNVATGSGVFHMWASDTVDQLWVNNDIDNTISVIDTLSLELIETVPLPADLVAIGGKPHDVILDPVAPFAYVTLIGFAGPNDYVVKYSTQSFLEVGRQSVGKDPHVSLGRQNKMLYVPCQNSNEVVVLDRATLTPQSTIPLPGAHGAAMARSGQFFYTTNLPGGGTNGLFEIDTKTNVVSGMWDTPLAVPHNIALSPSGMKLYITHSGATNDKVSVFARQNRNQPFSPITYVMTGLNPFGIQFVP